MTSTKLRANALPFVLKTGREDRPSGARQESRSPALAQGLSPEGLFCPYCIAGEKCAFHESTQRSQRWDKMVGQARALAQQQQSAQLVQQTASASPQPTHPPPLPPTLLKNNEADLTPEGGFCPWCRMGGCPIHSGAVASPEKVGAALEIDERSTDIGDSDSADSLPVGSSQNKNLLRAHGSKIFVPPTLQLRPAQHSGSPRSWLNA